MKDIDTFLDLMETLLSKDMITYIISFIYHETNLKIINKQKQLKLLLHKELNKCYIDNNFMLYKNTQNQYMLRGLQQTFLNNHQFYLYSNSNDIYTQSSNLLVCNNEILLIDNKNRETIYDENGLPIKRIIKLHIVYI
jgi:hypothetical protein